MDPLGGNTGQTDQLLGADIASLLIVGGALLDGQHEGQVEQVHLQAHLFGDANEGRVREGGEVDVADQCAGVVGLARVGRIDGDQLPAGGNGLLDHRQRRQALDLGMGVVDDDRPGAVRVAVRRRAWRAVNGPHLGARVGRHSRGVERGVLDVVAHAAHVVLTHGFHVEQGAAVVQVELPVPAVVHDVAEVHELRRRADVELQALEDGQDVGALVLQRLLHAPGIDRAGARPLLDGDLQHFRPAETADAPRHAGPVDQLADQQEFGDERRQLSAGQRREATGG